MFDEVLRDERTGRLARRASYLAWSTAIQVAAAMALASIVTAMTTSAIREVPPPIPVMFVKGAPHPLAAPPVPAPAPPPPRTAARSRRAVAAAAIPQLVQPKVVPDQLAPPGPVEPPAPEPPAGAQTVVGGVVGGGGGGEGAAPPARPEFDAASMTRPTFVSGPDPAYTRAALDREVEGLMVVACVVTREGLVRDCQVRQGLPFMDAAVVQALERRRYRPATLRGEPIEVTYHFRLNLRLPR